MGVIDKLWIKITCEHCGCSETLSVLDKGSSYGGSHWGNPSPSTKFSVVFEGGGTTEPTITSAKCVACNCTAVVKEKYGFGRPEGF